MNNIDEFVSFVTSSRKRTGIVYCSELFNPRIKQFESVMSELHILDCAMLFNYTCTFSPKELLDLIEQKSKNNITLVLNLETFIVSNSSGFLNQIVKLSTSREPAKPIIYFFYSKKIFRNFKEEYETKILNKNNILEL
jgi:hypothetical protein